MSEAEDGLPPWPWTRGKAEGEIVQRASDAAVGLWVLTFDHSRRVYRRCAGISSAPIERYYFSPQQIVGETRVSWLVGGRREPYPKKLSDDRPRRFYSLEDVEDYLWVNTHGFEVADRVRAIRDPVLIRKVAELVGYHPD